MTEERSESAAGLSFKMGEALLRNGAEIFRVQETMERVARAYDIEEYDVYVLSNASIRLPDHDNWKNILPVPDLYDGVFFSASYGYIKPQRKIYELFLERFQLKAEDCFFVDDLDRNIAAGRECGIEGYRFDGNIPRLREVLGI